MTSVHPGYKKATTKLQIVSHLDWLPSSHLVRHWGKWTECRLIQTFPLLEHTSQSFRRMGMKSRWSASNSLHVICYNLIYIFSPFSGFITVLLPQWRDFACEGVYVTQKKPLNYSKAGIIWTINLTLTKLAKCRDILCGTSNFLLTFDQSVFLKQPVY